MANPQKENGYISIANDILTALIAIRISGEARQCLDFIIRKTYGFNKTEDEIALSQFITATNLKKTAVCKALSKLQSMNLIITKKGNAANLYKLNKDYEKWKPLPKKVMKNIITKKGNQDKVLPKNTIKITKKGNKSLPKKGTTKDNITKDNITKDIIAAKPSNEVNDLIDFFRQTVNPHLGFNNKTERKAAEDLIKAYGLEKVKQMVLFLEERRQVDTFLPTVTTPYELLNKTAKIKQHLQRYKAETKGIRI